MPDPAPFVPDGVFQTVAYSYRASTGQAKVPDVVFQELEKSISAAKAELDNAASYTGKSDSNGSWRLAIPLLLTVLLLVGLLAGLFASWFAAAAAVGGVAYLIAWFALLCILPAVVALIWVVSRFAFKMVASQREQRLDMQEHNHFVKSIRSNVSDTAGFVSLTQAHFGQKNFQSQQFAQDFVKQFEFSNVESLLETKNRYKEAFRLHFDQKALNAIKQHAMRIGVFSALSPFKFLSGLNLFVQSVSLARELSRIYRGRRCMITAVWALRRAFAIDTVALTAANTVKSTDEGSATGGNGASSGTPTHGSNYTNSGHDAQGAVQGSTTEGSAPTEPDPDGVEEELYGGIVELVGLGALNRFGKSAVETARIVRLGQKMANELRPALDEQDKLKLSDVFQGRKGKSEKKKKNEK